MLDFCSWVTHRDSYVLFESVQFIKASQPRCAVIENVMGLSVMTDGETMSPADVLTSELQKIGYVCAKLECDLGIFHRVRRQRQANLAWQTIGPIGKRGS